MLNRETIRWFFGSLAAALLVIALAAAFVRPTAGLAQGARPNPASPQAGYASPLLIPAAEFTNDGNAPADFFFDIYQGRIQGKGAAGTGEACMKAPAYLPDGADLTGLTAYVLDNDPNRSVTVTLSRHDNTQITLADILAEVTSTGATAVVQTLFDPIDPAGVNAHVDLELYSYYVTTCLDNSGTALYAAAIAYSGP